MTSFQRAFFAVSLFAAIGLLGAASAVFDPNSYLHAQRLVNVGNRRMNIYCSGSGSPTVILDAGLGGSTLDWRLVQPRIAQHTRVCSYDRAGMGFSAPASSSRDAGAVVSDLHALLTRAGIAPPYVLVGHSIAGLYVRLYADRYPRDVVGLVLIDPSVEYQDQRFQAIWSGWASVEARVLRLWTMCANAAAQRQMGPRTTAYKRCIRKPNPPLLGETLSALHVEQFQRVGTWKDIISERIALDARSSAEVRGEQRSYGSMPLIVLTAGKTLKELPVSQAQRIALSTLWDQMHNRVAALSSRGVNIVVTGSGHFIQLDRPAVVISAVDRVVDQARYRR